MKTIEDSLFEERSRLRLEPALPFKLYAALSVCSWTSKDKSYLFPRASREYACAIMALLAPNNSSACRKENVGDGVHFLVSLGFVPMDDIGEGRISMSVSELERLERLKDAVTLLN